MKQDTETVTIEIPRDLYRAMDAIAGVEGRGIIGWLRIVTAARERRAAFWDRVETEARTSGELCQHETFTWPRG